VSRATLAIGQAVIWDEANRRVLSEGWAAGTSASKIAAKIPGATKNSVIGAARRFGLSTRVSPIGKAGASDETILSELRLGRSNNEIGAMHHVCPKRVGKIREDHGILIVDRGFAKRPIAPKPKPEAKPMPTIPDVRQVIPHVVEGPPKVVPLHAAGCCWPIGEPGTKGFRLCDAPVEMPTKANPIRRPYSYCKACRSVAYLKITTASKVAA
jgi:GcrA cell cycle regulator